MQAADAGNIEMIRWARERGCPWSVTNVMTFGTHCFAENTFILYMITTIAMLTASSIIIATTTASTPATTSAALVALLSVVRLLLQLRLLLLL
jgi:hypothetical protein